MLLIPAIDLKEGQCVRLRQGRMEETTYFSDNPVEMARRWVDQGAKRLHLVDLDGAFSGRPENPQVIAEIAKNFPDVPIQVGGGIRDRETVMRYLDCGIQYVIIGTKAITTPLFLENLCIEFPGHVILGLDARDNHLAVDGWSKLHQQSPAEFAKKIAHVGIEAVVFTDIARDGMMSGFNAEATADLAREINVPVIASGGISSIEDLKRLSAIGESGVMGAIIGRALYEGTLDLAESQQLLEQYQQESAS
jgi:phosphoribosylformimino-5-aminoimidazole carboxamide ribotide isomerase